MTEPQRAMTLRERAVGRISLWCLTYLAGAAKRRKDWHEAMHCAAALRAGDTSPEGHEMPCAAGELLRSKWGDPCG